MSALVALAFAITASPSGAGSPSAADDDFRVTLRLWNGDIFWEPASASSNPITRFGDEARSVFGPIPYGDCAAPGSRVMPVEVDGNVVDLRRNPSKPNHPLEFEHRDASGTVVKWTEGIPRCDKPSLAGPVTFCGLNSRLNRVVNGNVEWLFLCRKSNSSLEVGPDPYWLGSNPKFALFGAIGFNSTTGEIVFFDGRKDKHEFDWSEPLIPPGGASYSDTAGRAAAEDLYDPTFEVACFACHDNKNAYVVTPHAGQARVGYFAGEDGPQAKAFSLGDYLPKLPRTENTPFRVIGSGYTARYSVDLSRAKTVRDPTSNCTTCHTLTTQVTGQRFAADAAGHEPWISNPSWAQTLNLRKEKILRRLIARHRTDWALRSGLGKIHPWMTPETGNDLSAQAPLISEADWRKLSDCLWDAGGEECGYRPLYTPCPSPGLGPEGDGFDATDFSAAVLSLPQSETGADRILRLSWRYLNGYGNVAQRDDVRFNVAVRQTAIPPDGRAPDPADYPGMNEATGESSGAARLITDASYLGGTKFVDPPPSTELRDYRIELPATCGQRYLVRILPKRFCFDQSGVAYGTADHLLYSDVPCD
jgi:hypothetical protein